MFFFENIIPRPTWKELNCNSFNIFDGQVNTTTIMVQLELETAPLSAPHLSTSAPLKVNSPPPCQMQMRGILKNNIFNLTISNSSCQLVLQLLLHYYCTGGQGCTIFASPEMIKERKVDGLLMILNDLSISTSFLVAWGDWSIIL